MCLFPGEIVSTTETFTAYETQAATPTILNGIFWARCHRLGISATNNAEREGSITQQVQGQLGQPDRK